MSAGMSLLAALVPMLALSLLLIWTTQKTKKKRQMVTDAEESYTDLANRAQSKLGDWPASIPTPVTAANWRKFLEWWRLDFRSTFRTEYTYWPGASTGAADLVEELRSNADVIAKIEEVAAEYREEIRALSDALDETDDPTVKYVRGDAYQWWEFFGKRIRRKGDWVFYIRSGSEWIDSGEDALSGHLEPKPDIFPLPVDFYLHHAAKQPGVDQTAKYRSEASRRRNWRKATIAILSIAAVIIYIAYLIPLGGRLFPRNSSIAQSQQEPKYQGKALSEWIALSKDADDETRMESLVALSHLKHMPAARERARDMLGDVNNEIATAVVQHFGESFMSDKAIEWMWLDLQSCEDASCDVLDSMDSILCVLMGSADPLLPQLHRIRTMYTSSGKPMVGKIDQIDMVIDAITNNHPCNFDRFHQSIP